MGSDAVALSRCDEYRGEQVARSVARVLDLVGGADNFVRPGESVFVKVNAVIAAAPDSGITTHPEVVRAVVSQLMKVTDRVIIGDSPGGPFNRTLLKRVYEKTGFAEVARQTGAELAMDTGVVEVSVPHGAKVKRLTLCRSMVEADRLVSVSKLKTNRFMNLTGPVKNMYGSVPGMNKFVYHSRFEDERDFADFIVDVYMAARPAFSIVDAVEVVHGEGARNGTVKKMNAIAAGRDAFALENLMVDLAGLEPSDDKVLAAAIRGGVCESGTGWFEVLGEDPDGLRVTDFQLPARNFFSEHLPATITGRFSRFFTATPRPVPGACTGCGTCAEMCPRQAISVRDGLARVDRQKCIRCWCCDELCEHQAIGIRTPLLARMAGLHRG